MYKRILLSIDLHEEASWRKALPNALELHRAFGCEIHVVTVVPDLPEGVVSMYLTDDAGSKLHENTVSLLAEFIATHFPDDITPQCHTEKGSVYSVIIRTAERIGADLIVMGSHRPEMEDYLLGPNAARVVRHSKISVLVVRG